MTQRNKIPGTRLPTLPAMEASSLKSKPNPAPPRTITVWIGDTAFRAVLV